MGSTVRPDLPTVMMFGRDAPRFSLIVSSPEGMAVVSVDGFRSFVIGRAHGCDVVVDDGAVSRRHALLRMQPELSVEDLGSRNGTKVRGERLVPGKRVPIGIGTVVEVGNTSIVLQRGSGFVPSTTGHRPSGVARVCGAVVGDAGMRRLHDMLDAIAPSDKPVLLSGEHGVGKEIFAAELHARSHRGDGPFVAFDCETTDESLVESELFGHVRGAFPGADRARVGAFETAHGGTLVLDEIGSLPLAIQPKLVEALDRREIVRLGENRPVAVDVRIVSATSRDLAASCQSGSFQSDLFARLDGIALVVPPLRRRPGDIAPLAAHFLRLAVARHGRSDVTLTHEAILALESHDWPGNVRELRSVIERAVLRASAATLTAADLALGNR